MSSYTEAVERHLEAAEERRPEDSESEADIAKSHYLAAIADALAEIAIAGIENYPHGEIA